LKALAIVAADVKELMEFGQANSSYPNKQQFISCCSRAIIRMYFHFTFINSHAALKIDHKFSLFSLASLYKNE
jgi:hypothetical protein